MLRMLLDRSIILGYNIVRRVPGGDRGFTLPLPSSSFFSSFSFPSCRPWEELKSYSCWNLVWKVTKKFIIRTFPARVNFIIYLLRSLLRYGLGLLTRLFLCLLLFLLLFDLDIASYNNVKKTRIKPPLSQFRARRKLLLWRFPPLRWLPPSPSSSSFSFWASPLSLPRMPPKSGYWIFLSKNKNLRWFFFDLVLLLFLLFRRRFGGISFVDRLDLSLRGGDSL